MKRTFLGWPERKKWRGKEQMIAVSFHSLQLTPSCSPGFHSSCHTVTSCIDFPTFIFTISCKLFMYELIPLEVTGWLIETGALYKLKTFIFFSYLPWNRFKYKLKGTRSFFIWKAKYFNREKVRKKPVISRSKS